MSELKPTFFWSDLHIGHAKAIIFDERPFRNVDEMHEALITRYNSTVPENGICYFLGDIGNKPEEIRKVISRMHGTKVCILGNHDGGINTMYNCGFDVVLYSASIYIGDRKLNMTHCPYLGVWREDTSNMKNPGENWHGEHNMKHRKYAMHDDGNFLIHGHIHSRKGKEKSQKILGKQYDVGVCANNFTPISLSTIESWVMTYGKESK